MKMKICAALISLGALLTILTAVPANAADGTLKVTFKSKDPATGVEKNLNVGFIYLRDTTRGAPMEKFFAKPDYIFGPSNSLNGEYSYNVPAGKYFIRLLQRKVVAGASRPYGPPEAGDLTWFQTTPVTIVAGATLDLGTKYANPFGSTITITGIVKNISGAPLAGRYIRLQTVPCIENNFCGNGPCEQETNLCGQPTISAVPTDVNGKYTLNLRDPGTYYVYTFSSWNKDPGCSGYCAPPIESTAVGYPGYVGGAPQLTPITVQMGESKTADIVTY